MQTKQQIREDQEIKDLTAMCLWFDTCRANRSSSCQERKCEDCHNALHRLLDKPTQKILSRS